MRGLVMEVTKDFLIVLTDKGEYLRIKNDGLSAIGDMVPFDVPSHQPAVSLRMPRRLVAMAASFLLLCTAGLGAYGYSQPFGVVNVDINPSVALTYNWFSRVIAVEALNADAQQLLPALGNLKNQPVTKAVEEVIAAASDAGFLKPELANVVFVSVSDRNDPSRTAALVDAIEKTLPVAAGKSDTVLFKGSKESYDKSHSTHDSAVPDLIEKSIDNDSKNDPDTLSKKTVKDILKEQKKKRDELKMPEKIVNPNPGNADDSKSKNEDDKPNGKPDKVKEPKQPDSNINKTAPDPDGALNPLPADTTATPSKTDADDSKKDNPGKKQKSNGSDLKKNPQPPQ